MYTYLCFVDMQNNIKYLVLISLLHLVGWVVLHFSHVTTWIVCPFKEYLDLYVKTVQMIEIANMQENQTWRRKDIWRSGINAVHNG